MLAAATISLFLTNLLQRMIVNKDVTHTPTSGHRRRSMFHGSSKGSLQNIYIPIKVLNMKYFALQILSCFFIIQFSVVTHFQNLRIMSLNS